VDEIYSYSDKTYEGLSSRSAQSAFLATQPSLSSPSDVVPTAAAFYLLGPEMGEPPGGGDEDEISMAKGDNARNSLRPSRIEFHQHTPFKNFSICGPTQ